MMARMNHVPVSHGRATSIDGICVGTDWAKMMMELLRNIKITRVLSSRDKNNVASLCVELPFGCCWFSMSDGMPRVQHTSARL